MYMTVKIAANGRMVLPKSVRAALGIENAGMLSLAIDGDEVKLTSIQARIKRAQALYREHCKGDYSVDDFLRERREETLREEAKGY